MSKEKVDNKNSKRKKNIDNNKKDTSDAKKNSTKKTITKDKVETKTKANDKKGKAIKAKKDVKKVDAVLEEKLDEELFYDEDLEDFYYDDVEDVEKTVIVKKEKDKKEEKNSNKKKDKERVNIANIKKVEKMAKKNNKVKKNNTTDKVSEIGYFLDNNRNVILAFFIGVIITVIIAFIIWPERIATLKNGEQPVVKVAGKTYTADNLYKRMKDHYSVSQLLDEIDNDILTKKYPETDEMKKEVF